ncbi:MAG: hypothetical protein ACRC01_01270 [Deefgea sp.]
MQAAEWGRLFYSEQDRLGGIQTNVSLIAVEQKALQSQRFDGELQTPRGKVHWVNGQRANPPKGVKPGESWHEAQ